MAPNADQHLLNADWIKTLSWPFPAERVGNVADLRAFASQSGLTVPKFKKLPAYLGNLRRRSWLKKI